MKKILITVLALVINISLIYSQERNLPNIEVKTLDGNSFNIQELENDNNPIVISFWATWCKPCKKELNNYEYFLSSHKICDKCRSKIWKGYGLNV